LYGGQTADDLIQITSNFSAGPFTVSSQNTNTTWIQGETETITWNVAGTDNTATVNCQTVHILFSAKGDFTDTVTLIGDTPNDGSEDIIVPSSLTTAGKLMIAAADNVFLDVNNATIIIAEVGTPTFFLTALELSKTRCNSTDTIDYEFEYVPSAGFVEVVTFSATGAPTDATASFSPTTAGAVQTVITMTVADYSGATAKDYAVLFTGTSVTVTKDEPVNLTLKGTNFEVPVLNSPADQSAGQSTFPTYVWSEDTSGASESYVIEIAEDANFNTILETAKTTTGTYTQKTALAEGTSYFWRVQPKNECGDGVFTLGNIFSTGVSACLNIENNTPTAVISTLTTSSTINISEDISISDLNVTVNITHPYIGDVVVDLVSPAGTAVSLIASKCGTNDDMEATFDDLGEATVICSSDIPSISGTLKPSQPLSAFNGEPSAGNWTLNITDTGIGDDGFLTSWSIDYCGITEGVVLSTQTFNDFNVVMYPNPATDVISIKFNNIPQLEVTLFDLLGRKVLSKMLRKDNKGIDVSNLASGTYIVQMKNDNNEKIIKNLIIE
jgi:subtilisin-like proprotein convertase family protein